MPDFVLDDSALQPNFIRPELLNHPTIPGPMAGVNPRNLFGPEWWDPQRRTAYMENDYCCWACGISSVDDPFRPALEGHETYLIDYNKCFIQFEGVVALCHCCHQFIHVRRLWHMMQTFQVTRFKVQYIVESRCELLCTHGLRPNYWARLIELLLHGGTFADISKQMADQGYQPPPVVSTSRRWYLLFEGVQYYADRYPHLRGNYLRVRSDSPLAGGPGLPGTPPPSSIQGDGQAGGET